jgi:hypothetical protein
MKYTVESRGFYWLTRSESFLKENAIVFGCYPPGGRLGADGEIKISWGSLGGKLEIFDDALGLLSSLRDLIDEMALLPEGFTERQFIGVLRRCSFRDLTEYEKQP